MPAQIRPNRLEVTDRFPMLGFTIRTNGSPQRAEVTVAVNPALFRPEHKAKRTPSNFYSSRAGGPLAVPRGEAVYVLPPEVLARFIGQERLYFAVATSPEGNGSAMRVEAIPDQGSPYVQLRGLTRRSLRRVRLVPTRQERAAGYGANGKATLEWAGDVATPGAVRVGNEKTATPAAPASVDYDDGFGPLTPPASTVTSPPPTTGSDAPAVVGPPGAPATAIAYQPLPGARARALDLGALAVTAERQPVTAPSVTRLTGWQTTLAQGALAVLGGPLGPAIAALPAAAQAAGVSIGVGPAVGAGLGAGVGLGVGLVFGADGGLGVYGAAEFEVGFLASISATAQVTVVRGGLESFNGWGLAAAVSAGEGLVGGAAALFDLVGNFQGVSFQLGVGVGLTPVDFYVAVQRQVAVQLSTAQAYARAGARTLAEATDLDASGSRPIARGMVVGLEDRQKARKYARKYMDLFQWSPRASVINELTTRGFAVQTLDAAVGDLNLDFYEVLIRRFPDGWDAPRLLQHFIRNIDSFMNTFYCSFTPFDGVDEQRLASSNPLGTVFELDLPGPDRAAIVISDVKPQFYAVTTINTPRTGDHPVSGHRQFGYFVVDDRTTFYTRGADRATLGLPGTETAIFLGAELLWQSFQEKLAAFINDSGGTAEIAKPFSERFNAQAVREEFGHYEVAQGLSTARAMSNESFTLNWDEVEAIPQPSDVSCWAAAAAMVVGWKERVSLGPETLAAVCNRTTATGLDPAQVGAFAGEIGLVADPPQSYTIDGFRKLLETKGPLWVGAAVPGLHAIVVTGMYSDGAASFVRVTDPWDRHVGTPGAPGAYLDTHATGSRYILRWEDFVREYEAAATDFGSVNLQVLHPGGTAGRTANYGSAAGAGYALGRRGPQAAVRPRALEAQSFSINWDEVEAIPQPSDYSCWAAAAAMVVGWRDRVSLSPQSVAEICGRTTATGLDAAEIGRFGAEMGLTAEAPRSYGIDGFRALLQSNGPLWVAASVPGAHAIVVTGIYGEGDRAQVRVTDPWDRQAGPPGAPGAYLDTHATGSRYILKWEDFVHEYEALATVPSVNLQILHAGGTGGRTPNYGSAVSAGYAQALRAARATSRDARYARAHADPGTTSPGAPPAPSRRREVGVAGTVRWTLEQYDGFRGQGPAPSKSGAAAATGRVVRLDDWPLVQLPEGDVQLPVTVSWRHQGGAVGDVAIVAGEPHTVPGWSVATTAEIADGPDAATAAALSVRVRQVFGSTGRPDVVALTQLTLFGDGTYQRHDQWERAEAGAA